MKIEFEQGSAKKEVSKFWNESKWYLLVLSIPAILVLIFILAVIDAGINGRGFNDYLSFFF